MQKNFRVRPTLQALADLFFPRDCTVCGCRLGRHERHLCLNCELELPQTYFWALERNVMADKLNALIQSRLDRACTDKAPQRQTGSCRDGRGLPHEARQPDGQEPYVQAAALFYYNADTGYGRIPQALKYAGAIGLGRDFARRLASRLKGAPAFRDVTLVVPVPLHWTRQWKRGYNQAAVLAREIAAALNVPCDETLLYRRRRTRTQTRLAPEEKTGNVDGAFAVRRNRLPGRPAARYSGTGRPFVPATSSGERESPPAAVHILLVDDVFTTGATLETCHATLRAAWRERGIVPRHARISVATLAYVGRP